MIIFSKEGCLRCEQVKKMNPEAEVCDINDLFDKVDMDKASKVMTASNGSLPILKIGGHFFAALEV